MTVHRNQMWTDTGKPGKPAFFGRQMCRPAPDYGQGRAHVRPVGANSQFPPRLFDAPRKTGGSCQASPVLFISHCARSNPSAAAHRPLVRAPGGRAATLHVVHDGRHRRGSRFRRAVQFSAALFIGRGHQLYRISDKPGSDLAYPLHRSTPSVVRGFQHPELSERRNGTVLYLTRTLLKEQGARQHECR